MHIDLTETKIEIFLTLSETIVSGNENVCFCKNRELKIFKL